MDLNARIPSSYREKELAMRKTIASTLVRGKVDFSLYIEATAEETSTVINKAVVKEYMRQLGDIEPTADNVELLKMVVRMPDSLKTEREEINAKEFEVIQNALQYAIKELDEYRIEEGKVLEKDFLLRVQNISTLLKSIIGIDDERMVSVKTRLRKALDDLKEQVDENRFEQELIYYLEKFDITEEKVRLSNHLDYFSKSLHSADSNGKKLGFITQEIGREINTIGSKSNYAPMQQLVVQMKDELEKIKEQLLNVL